jgi:hypothetical protein
MNVSINKLIDKENMYNNKILINDKSKLKNYEHLFVKQSGVYGVEGLQKYLTKEIWEKSKELKTNDGVHFIDCVYPGIKEINSDILMSAGSKQCYEKFGDIFNPFIQDEHGHSANKKKTKTEMNSSEMNDTKLETRNKAMIEGVRISIKRNFDGIPFGPSGPS